MSTPKNTKTHTPTPWEVSALDYWSIVGDGKHIADCRVQDERTIGRSRDHESEANAELIVRAVNAHEALVSALTETLRALRAHIASDAARTGIVAEYFCPCTKNEVARAEAAIRAARGES